MENITNKTFVRQLAGYSALAVAGLAVAPADAAVISSGPGFTPITVAPGETKGVPFGPLGNVFQFAGAPVYGSYISAVIQRGANAFPTQQVAVSYGNDPMRFGSGALINGALNFASNDSSTGNDIAGFSAGFWNDQANPGNVVRGFLGFRFTGGAGIHYGFFDVSYDNAPSYEYGTMTIHGWAYEDAPNTGITTFAQDAAGVPEPQTVIPTALGLLAMGAAGIRTKRKKAAQQEQ